MTQTFIERAKDMAREEKLYQYLQVAGFAKDLDRLIDTLLTTAYEEFERELGEKGIQWMQEGQNKSGKGYTDGYNTAHTKALEAARKVLLGNDK